ncbi:hypothetical protein D1007_00807 [Hordeum vulgare]|nr:hypothetical protein D1007_00807 [Hordeum vulgare]
MDDDLEDAAAGLASLTSSGTAPASRGKPCAPRKTVAPPNNKKELTPEERAVESAKRKGRRNSQDARGEAAATAATQQEDTNAWVKVTTRESLLYLGVKHGLVNADVAVAATSRGSSA